MTKKSSDHFQFCIEREHELLANLIQHRIHDMCISVAFEHEINSPETFGYLQKNKHLEDGDREEIYLSRLAEVFLETLKLEEFKQLLRL